MTAFVICVGSSLLSITEDVTLCIRLDADEKEECLLCMGDRLLCEESVHEYMAV